MNKLSNTAKKLDRFIQFLFVLTIIVGIIALVGAVAWVYVFYSDFAVPFYSSIDLGFVQFMLSPEYLPSTGTILAQYVSALALGSILVALTAIQLKIVRNILKPMKESKPFHNTISSNLKKLGWMQIIGGILANCVGLVQFAAIAYGYDLQAIFVGDSISHITCNMEFDLTFILIGCVLFLASYIFRYGEELQQLSDETL